MGSSEKFCLRWNDFETNISVAFRELREEKDFFDVTLACDDSQVQAHKVILSACSPFFRHILRKNPHQHPLLYLKGVKYKELLCVLNFMYMGEVNVAQEELNSFLAVAEDLRVKGLTQDNNQNSDSKQTTSKPTSDPPRPPPPRGRDPPDRDPGPPPKRPRPTPPPSAPAQNMNNTPRQSYQSEEDDEIQEVVPVKSEPRDPPPSSTSGSLEPTNNAVQQYAPQSQPMVAPGAGTVALDDTYGDDSYDYGEYGDDSMGAYDDTGGMIDPNTGLPIAGAGGADGNKEDIIRATMVKNMEGHWECVMCQHTSQFQTNMKNHIEANHITGGSGYICTVCSKFCKTKNAFYIHRARYKHH